MPSQIHPVAIQQGASLAEDGAVFTPGFQKEHSGKSGKGVGGFSKHTLCFPFSFTVTVFNNKRVTDISKAPLH